MHPARLGTVLLDVEIQGRRERPISMLVVLKEGLDLSVLEEDPGVSGEEVAKFVFESSEDMLAYASCSLPQCHITKGKMRQEDSL